MKKIEFNKIENIEEILFHRKVKLLPTVTELFELQLAYLEYSVLKNSELIERAAYFENIDGVQTKHFKLCTKTPTTKNDGRSRITKNYFEKGKFSTGYATHGLFPYRGKFHPQLIKAIINIIGVEKNELILDPMCGSGTTNIEAALMGINSIAIDLSPFCQFMAKVKFESLCLKHEYLEEIDKKTNKFFSFFSSKNIFTKLKKITDLDKLKIYNLLLLAYLDALGYSKRVKNSTHYQLFEKVSERYKETIVNFQKKATNYDLGNVKVLEKCSAKNLPLDDESIDAVITSPPYSFAIDYIKNDSPQLTYLGYDINKLRNEMIGLVGKNKKERIKKYFEDMDTVCSEISRVLKPERYLVMIIGSNTNQTGGIRLEQTVIDSCSKYNLHLVKSILKPIKGMRNTMKEEYILFFRK